MWVPGLRIVLPGTGLVPLMKGAIDLLRSFLGNIMQTPAEGFEQSIPGMRIALRGCLRDVVEGIIHCAYSLE